MRPSMGTDGDLASSGLDANNRRERINLLVGAAREGQAEAFDELVMELTPTLWQVARGAGLEQADAEDVIQTVWLSLLSRIHTIHTPAALTSWLIITTRREAWRVRKAERSQQPVDDDLLKGIPDAARGAEERMITDFEERQLWQAFRTLPQRCQELLKAVAFTQRPDYDAIAANLGMPRGSVGPTRGRCLDKLRTALGEVEAP